VDEGQIIGGLAQGIGWMTLEELAYSDDGRLLSRALSTYKAPDVYFTPKTLERLAVEAGYRVDRPRWGDRAPLSDNMYATLRVA